MLGSTQARLPVCTTNLTFFSLVWARNKGPVEFVSRPKKTIVKSKRVKKSGLKSTKAQKAAHRGVQTQRQPEAPKFELSYEMLDFDKMAAPSNVKTGKFSRDCDEVNKSSGTTLHADW